MSSLVPPPVVPPVVPGVSRVRGALALAMGGLLLGGWALGGLALAGCTRSYARVVAFTSANVTRADADGVPVGTGSPATTQVPDAAPPAPGLPESGLPEESGLPASGLPASGLPESGPDPLAVGPSAPQPDGDVPPDDQLPTSDGDAIPGRPVDSDAVPGPLPTLGVDAPSPATPADPLPVAGTLGDHDAIPALPTPPPLAPAVPAPVAPLVPFDVSGPVDAPDAGGGREADLTVPVIPSVGVAGRDRGVLPQPPPPPPLPVTPLSPSPVPPASVPPTRTPSPPTPAPDAMPDPDDDSIPELPRPSGVPQGAPSPALRSPALTPAPPVPDVKDPVPEERVPEEVCDDDDSIPGPTPFDTEPSTHPDDDVPFGTPEVGTDGSGEGADEEAGDEMPPGPPLPPSPSSVPVPGDTVPAPIGPAPGPSPAAPPPFVAPTGTSPAPGVPVPPPPPLPAGVTPDMPVGSRFRISDLIPKDHPTTAPADDVGNPSSVPQAPAVPPVPSPRTNEAPPPFVSPPVVVPPVAPPAPTVSPPTVSPPTVSPPTVSPPIDATPTARTPSGFEFGLPREAAVARHVVALRANPDDAALPCFPPALIASAPASVALEKGERPVLLLFYDEAARASRLAAADLWPVLLEVESRVDVVLVDLTPGPRRALTDDERKLVRRYYLGYVPTTVVLTTERRPRLLKSERVEPALVRAACLEAR